MKNIVLLIAIIVATTLNAQTTIAGTVLDVNNQPVAGVNVYLEGTYDGGITALDGTFSFETDTSGTAIFIASLIGYETVKLTQDLSAMRLLEIRFRESLNQLNTVVLNTGTLGAGDNSKTNVLNAMDVVTTASAAGDFIGALQTLPGTSPNPNDGRLFVRGGNADETQIFIDGNRVFSPYLATTGNIPTRGRFSPFLFDGISFSTGGYSAQYGDALSGVLTLNTTDFPVEEKTELGIMTVGVNVGSTQIWDDDSLSVIANYINLAPYNGLVKQNNRFIKPYQSLSGESVYRHKTTKGLFKAYAAYAYSDLSLQQEDIDIPGGYFLGVSNGNMYGNLHYDTKLGSNWKLATGISMSSDTQNLTIADTNVKARENALHAKAVFHKFYNNYFQLEMGVEQFIQNYDQQVTQTDDIFNTEITTRTSGSFIEATLFLSKSIALKGGMRADYYDATNQVALSPRLSAAVSITNTSQVSFAYGTFNQQAASGIRQYDARVNPEQAQHYIFNYLYTKNKRLFRAELYQKNYDNLITYNTAMPSFNSTFTNDGDGYAQGMDLFWRDSNTFKEFEYWVSYSYLDTQRKYRNDPQQATPGFATTHNVSVVGKKWMGDIKSQVGTTLSVASGRAFTNPNISGYLQENTKPFVSLDLNWAYLIDSQKIVYLSVSNVLGRDNTQGYQYSNIPDATGTFNRREIGQNATRFIFVGFFWTIGGSDNQLDNL